jgi:hypothetical protein
MTKLTTILVAVIVGSMALPVNAQTQQPGAAGVRALSQNATPIVKQAACRGYGSRCPPGWVWACGPYGRCACRPC